MAGMVFFLLLIFSPVIILLLINIKDSISDKIERDNRKKYYGTEEIFKVTTYQNKNVTEEDVMNLFLSYRKQYIQKYLYYLWRYKVHDDVNKQNYAWELEITKNTYGCGIIYEIDFYFSNGWICLKLSDTGFTVGDESSNHLDRRSDLILQICHKESQLMWKKHGREPYDNLPFNFYSINQDNANNKSNSGKKSSSSKNNKKQYDNSSSQEQSSSNDLIDFYRSLLGLKLNFTNAELKTAYHEAGLKYHPDSYGDSSSRDRANAELLMKQINAAYETLKK